VDLSVAKIFARHWIDSARVTKSRALVSNGKPIPIDIHIIFFFFFFFFVVVVCILGIERGDILVRNKDQDLVHISLRRQMALFADEEGDIFSNAQARQLCHVTAFPSSTYTTGFSILQILVRRTHGHCRTVLLLMLWWLDERQKILKKPAEWRRIILGGYLMREEVRW